MNAAGAGSVQFMIRMLEDLLTVNTQHKDFAIDFWTHIFLNYFTFPYIIFENISVSHSDFSFSA